MNASTPSADQAPGRSCPLRYRYGAAALARAALQPVETLYVVGGLYGNTCALTTVQALAAAEGAGGNPAVRLCFNGDFHWFDTADSAFDHIQQGVMAHDAVLGNVEAEFGAALDDAGCGCAYPESVDGALVARSNAIHRALKATAQRHPRALAQLAALPLFARYSVGNCRVAVVHGDADSLAGWRFDPAALDDPLAQPWLAQSFESAQVDVFASTHTCAPALRRVDLQTELPSEQRASRQARPSSPAGSSGWVVNNGAAGMPSVSGSLAGLCTRISLRPSPHPVLCEVRCADAYIALLPLHYDADQWLREFDAQWPAQSPAHVSYRQRITQGPSFSAQQALPRGE